MLKYQQDNNINYKTFGLHRNRSGVEDLSSKRTRCRVRKDKTNRISLISNWTELRKQLKSASYFCRRPFYFYGVEKIGPTQKKTSRFSRQLRHTECIFNGRTHAHNIGSCGPSDDCRFLLHNQQLLPAIFIYWRTPSSSHCLKQFSKFTFWNNSSFRNLKNAQKVIRFQFLA